jgi:hypothetical protein
MFNLRTIFSSILVLGLVFFSLSGTANAQGFLNFLKKKPEQPGGYETSTGMNEALRGGSNSNRKSSPIFLSPNKNNKGSKRKSPKFIGSYDGTNNKGQYDEEQHARIKSVLDASNSHLNEIMPKIERYAEEQRMLDEARIAAWQQATEQRELRERERQARSEARREQMMKRQEETLRLFQDIR